MKRLAKIGAVVVLSFVVYVGFVLLAFGVGASMVSGLSGKPAPATKKPVFAVKDQEKPLVEFQPSSPSSPPTQVSAGRTWVLPVRVGGRFVVPVPLTLPAPRPVRPRPEVVLPQHQPAGRPLAPEPTEKRPSGPPDMSKYFRPLDPVAPPSPVAEIKAVHRGAAQ